MDDISTRKIKQLLFNVLIIACVYLIFRLFFFNEQTVDIEIYNTKTNMENFREQLKYTIEDKDGNILDERMSSDQDILLQPMIPIGQIGDYYVKQQEGTTPHTIYDNTVYKIEIETGWLFSTAEIKIYKNDTQVDKIIFNNVYNEEYEIAEIECAAMLSQDGLNDSEFGLVNEDNIIVAKAKADLEGKIIFKVPFSEEGEFKYKLRDITNKEGHIRDGHDFRVLVSCEMLSRRLKISTTFYEGEEEIPKVVFGSGYNWEESIVNIPIYNATGQTIIADNHFGQQKEIPVDNSVFTCKSELPMDMVFYFDTKNHKYTLKIHFINNNSNILKTEYYLIKDGQIYNGDILID